MFKRLFSLVLVLALALSLSACGKEETPSEVSSEPDSSIISSIEEEPEVITAVNTLTGENNLDPAYTGKKPVAITVNNVRVAQSVQCGLHEADVVFETEVEGGITRLLAFFADPSKVGQIGTVRSLRVSFAEIATGMDAVLFYHGIDHTYCLPLMSSLDLTSHVIGAKTDSFRASNGLASEHTLYTKGELLDKVIKNKGLSDGGTKKPWLNFSSSEEKAAPSEQIAANVTVNFSSSYATQFIYDATEKKYARARKGTEYKDLITAERELFTNVFVLKTSITNYPDNYHRKISLSGGDGYYVSAGGYVPIKWTKGSSGNNFSFTNVDGSALTVNQGNSYVCIMGDSKTVTFE